MSQCPISAPEDKARWLLSPGSLAKRHEHRLPPHTTHTVLSQIAPTELPPFDSIFVVYRVTDLKGRREKKYNKKATKIPQFCFLCSISHGISSSNSPAEGSYLTYHINEPCTSYVLIARTSFRKASDLDLSTSKDKQSAGVDCHCSARQL